MFWRRLRVIIRNHLTERGLKRAMARHRQAAEGLDAALREVLQK